MRIREICLPETRSILQTHYKGLPPLRLLGCIDGLLVFDDVGYAARVGRMLRCPERILILNPITRESRVIGYPEGPPITPQTRKLGYVCAIFFDRFQHQHTLLHVSNRTNRSPVVYHTFSFNQTAWRRIQITHTTPSSSLAPENRVPPCLHTLHPVIVGDTLHWLVDQIVDGPPRRVFIKIVMALKIHSNEIHYFRPPITPTDSSFVSVFDCTICLYSYTECEEQQMQLIEHNGKLCFCHININGVIDIWSMEECSWVKMFKLNLPRVCTTPCWILNHHQIWGPMILSFPHKDVVAVKWTGNKIYLYHLGTYKACRIKDGMVQTGREIINYRFIAFNKTLLSPNITF